MKLYGTQFATSCYFPAHHHLHPTLVKPESRSKIPTGSFAALSMASRIEEIGFPRSILVECSSEKRLEGFHHCSFYSTGTLAREDGRGHGAVAAATEDDVGTVAADT
ncbi:hypothetical protein NE237_032417 [Protea cynaroides]|uniref:Uncharacterized protein n=1 Tax=Protea cynaroides TaxID=273540 RepID=A0A9Q0R328_9MAGN|nr:hypothetical protein NE237_032417 [Protea cynaroides]